MKLSISDFRNVRRAEFDLGSITLISGENEAGKSSVCMAIGAALTQDPKPRGMPKAALVRDGSAIGVAALEHDAGSTTIAWPVGTVSTTGTPLRCGAFSAGLARLSAMRPDDRAKALQEALGAHPTIDDLRAALPDAPDAHIQAAWSAIKVNGWDGAHAAAKTKGAELKGRWREVTGEQYGSAKALSWKPAGLEDEDADLPIAELQKLAAEGRKAAAMAVVTAEQRKGAAKAIEEIRATLPALQEAANAARGALTDALYQRANAPAVSGDTGLPCPWCGNHVRVERDAKMGSGYYRLEKFEEAISKEEIVARTKALAALDAAVQEAQKASRDADGALATAEAELARNQKLIDTPEPPDASGMEGRASAAITYRRAKDIAAMVTANAAVVEALAPSGVRARVMGAALKRLNDEIFDFVAAAAEPDVAAPMVSADMSITRAGRPYELLSESAQFRADVAIQVALAKLAGDPMVVIDRADVLDADGRNALFAGLLAAGVPALVAMTFSAKRLMPDLSAIGGRSYWMEG